MKHKNDYAKLIAALAAMFVWWGILFPEFSLTGDNLSVYCETEGIYTEVPEEIWKKDPELLSKMLTSKEDVTFRSGILKDLRAFWEAFSWNSSIWN